MKILYFFSVLANLLSCFVFSGTRPTCAPARALLLWGLRLLVNDMRIIAPLFVVASGLIILVCTTSMSRVDKSSGDGLAPNVETTAQGETAENPNLNPKCVHLCQGGKKRQATRGGRMAQGSPRARPPPTRRLRRALGARAPARR